MTRRSGALSSSLSRWLGYLSWAVLAGGVTYTALRPGVEQGTGTNTVVPEVALAVFFVLLVVRLLLLGWTERQRGSRAAFVLAGSILLWAAGSAALTAGGKAGLTRFPAPGEWLFIASYLSMAGFLLMDAGRRGAHAVIAWLDVAVMCGATASLAGAILLTPVAAGFGPSGVPLMVALLYPLADLVLGLLVVAQMVLRLREGNRRTAGLCLGFLLWMCADSSFVVNLSSGTYKFGALLYAGWGGGIALIVASACLPRPDIVTGGRRRQGPAALVGASSIAVLVLVARPTGLATWYVTGPAVLTLAAAGSRMWFAMREARGAADAHQMAVTDDLTRLPNRRAVLRRLDSELQAQKPLALMLLDLDGFKEINDTLGHSAGDAVLEQVATRMRAALPAEVLLARLGGDEFALVLPKDDPTELLETAKLVRDVLARPLRVDELELAIGASVGITVRAQGDTISTDLLRRADVAMYQAKVTKEGALLYDSKRDDFSRQRLRQAEDLRRGIASGELAVWYQPQVDAVNGAVAGVEALVRWSHPREGLVLPAMFLPQARRSGMMLALSEAVIELALADAERWAGNGVFMRVAVNIAPAELLGGLLLPRLFEAVDRVGLPPDALVIEVTEDSFLADPERARAVLQHIRARQIQISIDDYGTGFSSLSYLRDLPVQEIKLDRSFVSSMRSDARSKMIIESTRHLAQGLGLRLVAEGVEDLDTMNDLADMGVALQQGFFIARPMPAMEVEAWVRRWSKRTPAHTRSFGDAGRSDDVGVKLG
jgi:diguanylate cyclase (GGDEF)-like protein